MQIFPGARKRGRSVDRVVLAGGILLLLFLGVYNQPYYPVTWLDEGFTLQGAVNLARFGQYAMRSAEGFRVLDQPLIANGPGVVLPISTAFRLFGVGLLQARLVMVAFLVLAAVIFWTLAVRLSGRPAAAIAAFFLVALPGEGFLLYGRQALGVVPSLAYFLAGYLLWLRALKGNSDGQALAAGLLFGLAIVTKGQYILLLPILLIAGGVDFLYGKQIGLRKIAIATLAMLVCFGVWNVIQLILVGPANFFQHLDAIRASSRVTVYAFSAARIPGNVWYLLRSGILLVILPGFIYAGWSYIRRDPNSDRQIILLVLIPVWLAWYALASVGWHRYAFEPYVAGTLLTGQFVAEALSRLRSKEGEWSLTSRKKAWGHASVLLLIGALFAVSAWEFLGQIRGIGAKPDTSPQAFAAYLERNVSPEAVIESWEWEIDALADLNYHHPTNDVVDAMTAVLQLGEKRTPSYDPSGYNPDYLIDGPFSKWTGIYADYLAEGCCTHLAEIGSYDLFQVKRPALSR